MARTLSALGVHLFAGGFSLGVSQHAQVLAHLESSDFGVATWQRNSPGVPVIIDAVRQWNAAEALVGADPPDLVYGNPPCSAFSPMTPAEHRGPRSKLTEGIRDVIRVGARLRARVIVVESVRPLATTGRELIAELSAQYAKQYPASSLFFVNAINHGVCQNRPRLFWVLSEASFRPLPSAARPRPTLADALTGIPPSAPNQNPLDDLLPTDLRACLEYLEPGQSVADLSPDVVKTIAPRIYEQLQRWKRHSDFPRRLDPSRPGRVVHRGIQHVHPLHPRLLNARELARLMGIPDDFELVGPKRDWPGLLGKGVCPPVGAWLAREVVAYLAGQRETVLELFPSGRVHVSNEEPRCSIRSV